MRMKIIAASILLLSAALVGSAQPAASPVETFWTELAKLCGKAFVGTVVAAPADDTTFKDKVLVMHVRQCEKDRIRIPFVVGNDRSRTWVLTRKGGRIELRHDHRHEDGTPDKVTMYGGWTTSDGMATRQMFPADQETVKVVPAAATNVWWIDLVAGESFGYNLRRMGSERYFSIRFDLKTAVPAPEPPWGWRDREAQIGGSTILFSNSRGEWKPATGNLFVYVPDADATFRKAIDGGSSVVMEVPDQDYGRSGGITDPFGNVWWITSVSKN